MKTKKGLDKNIEDILPLSPAQAGILFHALYAPESSVYFEQFVCKLDGKINREAFSSAWQFLIDRHQILRSAFVTKHRKKPVQVVFRELPFAVDEIDWTSHSAVEQSRRLAEYLEHDRSLSFAFNRPPLMRVALIELAVDSWQLVWSHHHILMDGWSLTLLMGEFLTAYHALARGERPQLEARRPYGDYLGWLARQDTSKDERFWREYLSGFARPTPLGIGQLDSAVSRPIKQEHYLDFFTSDETAKLEALSREYHITLSSFFQAAWALLLSRYSGENDVVFGATLSGRGAPLPGIEEMIGIFINTLPVRFRINSEQPLLEWLRETQRQSIDLQQYEYCDLTNIHRWCAVSADRQLFESLFVFENFPADTPSANDTVGIHVVSAELIETTNFPLSMVVIPGERLRLKLSYDQNRISAHSAEQLCGHYRSLIMQMANGMNRPLSTFDLPSHSPSAYVFDELDSTEETLGERFARTAAAHRSLTALTFGDEHWTYERLLNESGRLAGHLRRLGVKVETRVGICLERSPQQIVAMLGVILAGGAYVPLDPAYPEARIEYMVADSECAIILTSSDIRPRLENFARSATCQVLCLDDCAAEGATSSPVALSADNAAYVIYTSGSTGRPKGVLVTHRNVMRLFAACDRLFQFSADDVWTYFHSFSFDFSVWEIWGALLHGARVVITPYLTSRDPAAFYELLSREHVTVLSQTPSAFNQLIAHERSLTGPESLSLRYVVFGGEALDPQSLKPWLEQHSLDQPQLINMYGITETTVHVTYHRIRPEDVAAARSIIGQPLPDLQIRLLDEQGRAVPSGVKGEICVSGPGLARGYLNDPEATANKFPTSPMAAHPGERIYRSGDLARRLPNGDLIYCGRLDHQVKVRGHRIETGEIGATLLKHEAIREAVVRAYTDESGETRLAAYAVCSDEKPGIEEFRFFLKQSLPDYMLPEIFIFCDSFPLTINGKLDFDALPNPISHRASHREGLQEEYVAPANSVESQLAEIWQGVLGVARVGRNDNFFALGGDSIRSVTIMSLARDKGIVFTLQQLFEQQTIAKLVQTLTDEKIGDHATLATEAFSLIAESDRAKLPADLEDAYPLARLQAGMLFHSHYGDGLHRYHDAFSFRLRIRFEESKWLSALQSMIADHPVLRTSFHFADLLQPLQFVHRTAAAPFAIFDLRASTEAEQEQRLNEWLRQQLNSDFNWESAPLFRLCIHRLRDDVIELSFIVHHAILDGWSAATFFRDLGERYLHLLNPSDSRQFGRPTATYREYIALEMEALASEDQRAFWKTTLSNPPQTKIGRWPHAQTPDGELSGFVKRTLARDLSERILAFARNAQLPVKSVLFAAHLRVMQMLTGSDDVITGLITNGRPGVSDSTRVLGLFLNTIPFRLQVRNCSWLALCKSVLSAETVLLKYRRFPLSEITRLNHNSAPFESSFNFVNFHVYEGLKGKDDVELLGTNSFEQVDTPLSANFSLDVADAGLHFGLMYDRSQFPDEQAEVIANYYDRALSALVADPLALHTTVDLLSDEERHHLLHEVNDTARPLQAPSFIHECMEQQAAQTPTAIAVSCSGRDWTYAELHSRSNQLARLILSKGAPPDTPIAVMAHRSFDMVCALLAILKAGCAYAPIDPDQPVDRIATILGDLRPPLLLLQELWLERVAETYNGELIVFERCEAILDSFSIDPLEVSLQPANLAYVLFTSGSTGKPKGVAVTHESLSNHMQWMQATYPLSADDVVLQKTTFTFDASVWEFWAPLMAGAKLAMARPGGQQDSSYLVMEIQAQGVTILQLVPSMLEVMIDEPGFAGCGTLRRLFVGGEALKTIVSRRFYASMDIPLINLYGPTEATIESSAATIRRDEIGVTANIGRPIFNARYYVLNQELRPVPLGVAGELYIGGVCLARGYWSSPDLTADRFIPDPFSDRGERLYRTGDLVRYLPDGALECLGRTDRQFKLRGFRVEMADIESALMSLDGVNRCVAVIHDTPQAESRLVAYYQLASAAVFSTQDIKQRLQARLPAYMVPAIFHQVDQWPLLPNGKTDVAALSALALAPDIARVSRGASSEIESTLIEVWQKVLRIEKLGIDDNFFDLGGDSILCLQIVAQARKQGVQFTPQDLFNNPSIVALAQIARREESRPVAPFVMNGGVPLTPIQRLFFEQDLPNTHHWNQAVLLEVLPEYSAARIKEAVNTVIAQHDAFHLRFSRGVDSWRQTYGDTSASFAFEEVDLCALPESVRQQEQEFHCNRAQSSLNITDGPVIRAVYFQAEATEKARLLIVCHHLVIDGVSWRILLEDFHTQLAGLDLPSVSLPFGAWARRFEQAPPEMISENEVSFWLKSSNKPMATLPIDFHASRRSNTYGSASAVRRELTPEETTALLTSAPQHLKASIAEVLLSCLTDTITSWTGARDLCISLEGHGRESSPELSLDDADLSRSIGWFTSIYPLRIESSAESALETRLAAIKRQIRRVPRNGVGYGLLRYMLRDSDASNALAGQAEPEISLNYLGQFDSSIQSRGPFRVATESTGHSCDPAAPRNQLIEVVALVVNDRLTVQWNYSSNLHRAKTIDDLADRFLALLKAHAHAAQAVKPACWIAQDFPLVQLTDTEFAEVVSDGRSFEDLWPLSPVQEGMLFHTLREGDASGVYIQQLTGEIRGHCDIRLLEWSWQIVLQQNANLRAAFFWEGLGRPLQKIEPHLDMPFKLIDWRAFDETEQLNMLQQLFDEDRALGFDLRRGSLMRLTFIRLTDDRWRLLWTHHHILLDGWSIPLILSQVVTAYRALRDGQTLPLPVAPYSRYLAWLQQQDRSEAENFWRRYLSGYDEPRLLASADESTESMVQSDDIDWRELMLGESLSDMLRDFAQRRQLTLSTVVQAAWGFVLSRHLQSNNIVYGVTVSGRPATLSGVETMVGLFINTLPVRVGFDSQQRIGEWLAAFQSSQAELLRFQHSRLVDIAGWSEIPRGKPLFDSILVFENYPIDESLRLGADDFNVEQLTAREQSHYPLTLYIMPGRDFKFSCSFLKSRLAHQEPSLLLAQLRQAICNLIEHEDGYLSDLELVSPTERKQILDEWNNTTEESASGLLVPTHFTQTAALFSYKTALISGQEQMSYRELEETSNRLANYLLRLGVVRESRVAILLDRTPKMIVSLLAVLKAGAAYIPLDPSFPKERLHAILAEAAPQVILSTSDISSVLPEAKTRCVNLDSEWTEIARRPPQKVSTTASYNDLAYLIFTSGSTGQPKGVQITHGALANILESFRRRPGLSSDDVFLAVTTISFDIAALEIFLPLLVGATLALAPREAAADGVALAKMLQDTGATSMQATPVTWRMLLAADWNPIDDFRAWCGGEALPTDLAEALLNRGLTLWNVYGPTETTIWSTIHQVTREQNASLIGRPISNTQVYVLDNVGNLLPPGLIGELCIGGDGLTRGYLNQPEMTAERLVPNPFSTQPGARLYRTGDLARFTADGLLECLGRIDLQTKVDGFRIELGDIEAALRSLPGVQQAAAAVVRDERGANRLVAYLVYEPTRLPHESPVLRDLLQEKLPAYMVPHAFVVIDALPLTPNNKLDRIALLTMTHRAEPRRFIEPRNPLEEALLEIWRDAFQRAELSVDDNFFDLGGHSLIATQIHAMVIKIFQVKAPLRELFRSPTIERLASIITQEETKSGQSDRIARAYLKVRRMSPEERSQALLTRKAANE